MCENGINTNQLQFSLDQLDETVALGRRWTHRLYHLADDRGRTDVSGELARAQELLDEAIERITAAKDAVATDEVADDVVVELV